MQIKPLRRCRPSLVHAWERLPHLWRPTVWAYRATSSWRGGLITVHLLRARFVEEHPLPTSHRQRHNKSLSSMLSADLQQV
eukprot:3772262-Pleurochrysis_carterae.AAC.4